MIRLLLIVFTGFTYFLVNPVLAQQKPIKPERKYVTKVPEPSDIAVDSITGSCYIVSDNGLLFKCDSAGNILLKAEFEGMDFEGVAIKENKVYVIDESLRKVHCFSKDSLQLERTMEVPYAGGRNKGYESLCWNASKGVFVMITEKSPILIYEFNEDFINKNQVEFTAASDISSARWHNGYVYLLSDEEHMVYQCDPIHYKVLHSWKITVLNPEGIDFGPNGELIIVSDDMHTLYYYSQL